MRYVVLTRPIPYNAIMFKRLAAILVLTLAPLTASADTASELGPTTSGGTGSPTGASSSLQPAGTSPVQSSTGAGSQLSAPTTGETLQGQDASPQLQLLLQQDADGTPQNVADQSGGDLVWLDALVAFVTLAAVFTLLATVVRRRLARRLTPHQSRPNQ